MRAIEFYSGIGGFAEAARNKNIEIMAAFDQYNLANTVYQHNFGLKPVTRTLDHIQSKDIPKAEIWWMSPPCTPFTIRGKKQDINDPRARSFLNLINLIPKCLPEFVLIENVLGFANSKALTCLKSILTKASYSLSHYELCPTQFGIPMKRPRCFIVASLHHPQPACRPVISSAFQPLWDFLDDQFDPLLEVEKHILIKHGSALNIVNPHVAGATLICFTSGYWKCLKASGSYLLLSDGTIRRLAPEEMLRLLGFSQNFNFPADIPLSARWHLVGNSVDTRSITYLIENTLLGTSTR